MLLTTLEKEDSKYIAQILWANLTLRKMTPEAIHLHVQVISDDKKSKCWKQQTIKNAGFAKYHCKLE